jgi:hypothetical protein
LFLPKGKTGIVVTNGPDIENRLIERIASVFYPNPVCLNAGAEGESQESRRGPLHHGSTKKCYQKF